MTVQEYEWIFRDVDFSKNSLCFTCMTCGDQHFVGNLGRLNYRMRKHCYRCNDDNVKITIRKSWS